MAKLYTAGIRKLFFSKASLDEIMKQATDAGATAFIYNETVWVSVRIKESGEYKEKWAMTDLKLSDFEA